MTTKSLSKSTNQLEESINDAHKIPWMSFMHSIEPFDKGDIDDGINHLLHAQRELAYCQTEINKILEPFHLAIDRLRIKSFKKPYEKTFTDIDILKYPFTCYVMTIDKPNTYENNAKAVCDLATLLGKECILPVYSFHAAHILFTSLF